MGLRLVFAGTPEFAATHLQSLLNSEHEVLAVFTQPDRPAGRGRRLTSSAVKKLALEHQLPIYQPQTLKDESIQNQLCAFKADVLVVVAYGLLLPKAVLGIPRLGCINVHASLLPAWRGAAPIQRAVEAGDQQTGVTIMQMNEALDTGDILLQKKCDIGPRETSGELFVRLASLGAKALVEALNLLERGELVAIKQDDTQACYAAKITKAEAELDWNSSAIVLMNKVRAFNPWPVAYMHFQNQICRIWRAVALSENSSQQTGAIIAAKKEGIDIQCKEGILRILELQMPGKKPQLAADFLNAQKQLSTDSTNPAV